MKAYGLNELREKFLSFFESKGHLRLPSFSLIPQHDKSLLLINSGMARDLLEFLEWRQSRCTPMERQTFPQTSKYLELHRAYSSKQIAAALARLAMTASANILVIR